MSLKSTNDGRTRLRLGRLLIGSENVRCDQPVTIITDKAHSYATVIREMNFGTGPDDAIIHVNRKPLNNRMESDHGALKQLLKPKRGGPTTNSRKKHAPRHRNPRDHQKRAISRTMNRGSSTRSHSWKTSLQRQHEIPAQATIARFISANAIEPLNLLFQTANHSFEVGHSQNPI
ncbi:MAG: DDE-type integrase/transposase/recombinase [Paracoccaceae bacterium]